MSKYGLIIFIDWNCLCGFLVMQDSNPVLQDKQNVLYQS